MTSELAQRRVAFIQRCVPHYRVAFFNELHKRLALAGIELTVYAGACRREEGLGDGRTDIRGCRAVVNRYIVGDIHWHANPRALYGFDLVVVEQANSALANYPIILGHAAFGRPQRLAFWGHGADLQAKPGNLLRRSFKRKISVRADHWFAYTDLSRALVQRMGFPKDRITVVNNSIAVEPFVLTGQERQTIHEAYGIGLGPVAIFCARLNEIKALPFAIASVRRARQEIQNLQLVVIGDGPLAPWLRDAAARDDWIRPLGARYGAEKSRLLAAADVFVLPSMVGLSIIDAFAAGLPVLAADFRNHSPEIAYLRHGHNGMLVPPSIEAYGAALVSVLRHDAFHSRLRNGALASSARFTLDRMVGNFASGIAQTLNSSRNILDRDREPQTV